MSITNLNTDIIARANNDGYTYDKGARTAFNEQEAESIVSYIEGAGTYGLIPANFRQFSATGGSSSTEGRLWKLSTGTSVGGYGAVQSFRSLPHRGGKGIQGRFSGYFTGSAASSEQGLGFLSIGEEMSFGYNGANFGIWHRYGGLSEVRTITITVAAGGGETLTLTLNSVEYSIPITGGTVQHNAYEIAEWLNDNQSIWGADQLNDAVILSALSDGAKSGTYSYSASGSGTGSIAQTTAGVTKTSDFVAQADWNGVELDFTLDPSRGNLYQINYQNMGWGDIIYSVMNPRTRRFEVVHTLRYPNSTVILGTPNPSMRCGAYTFSTGSTTNLEVYVSSVQAGVGGQSNKTRNPRSANNTVSLATTNETSVITLRNRRTYNGYNNQVEIQPLKVSVASEVNKNVILDIRASTNFGEELDYRVAGTNLVGDISTTAANITTGLLLDSITIEPNGRATIDLQRLQISMPPSLAITVEAKRTGGSAGDVSVTITWYEDL